MNVFDKNITIALMLSVLFIAFNIYAVTQGTADTFYEQIEALFKALSH